MAVLDKVIGALLLGTRVNGMVYTLEMVLVWFYFRTYPGDARMAKVAVAFAFLNDTIATVGFCAGETVTHWGDVVYIQKDNFLIPLFCITTGITSGIVQAFLCNRAGHMIKSRVLKISVLAFLLTCTFTSTASAFWAGITVIFHPAYSDRYKDATPLTVWLTTAASADVAIAATLLWQLVRARKEINTNGFVDGTLSEVLGRLIIIAIQTGTITSVFALIGMTLFRTDITSNSSVGFGFSFGRAYTIVMLVNLNTRNSLNERIQKGASIITGTRSSGRFGLGSQLARTPVATISVTVHREQEIYVDEPVDLEGFYMERNSDGLEYHVPPDSDLKSV